MEFQQGSYNVYEHNYSDWPEEKLHEMKEKYQGRIDGTEILRGPKSLKRFQTELANIAFEIDWRKENSAETVDA